ncbi:MAG: hypothetical protein GC164_00050 [Phycisphaera sp.]|nr:hypothetical protein [Phycisphaera sp.]
MTQNKADGWPSVGFGLTVGFGSCVGFGRGFGLGIGFDLGFAPDDLLGCESFCDFVDHLRRRFAVEFPVVEDERAFDAAVFDILHDGDALGVPALFVDLFDRVEGRGLAPACLETRVAHLDPATAGPDKTDREDQPDRQRDGKHDVLRVDVHLSLGRLGGHLERIAFFGGDLVPLGFTQLVFHGIFFDQRVAFQADLPQVGVVDIAVVEAVSGEPQARQADNAKAPAIAGTDVGLHGHGYPLGEHKNNRNNRIIIF